MGVKSQKSRDIYEVRLNERDIDMILQALGAKVKTSSTTNQERALNYIINKLYRAMGVRL